ncbi:MAG: hypothetical protein ACMXYK_05860, partial [Candidatus Woesearchaeota archaeon]
MDAENLEEIMEETFPDQSVFKPLVITTLVGSVAMGLSQELTADQTDNAYAIVSSGMMTQILARTPTYLLAHFAYNKERILSENKKINLKTTTQDLASIYAAGRIGYVAWMASCAGLSDFLMRQDLSPFNAGFQLRRIVQMSND